MLQPLNKQNVRDAIQNQGQLMLKQNYEKKHNAQEFVVPTKKEESRARSKTAN